MDLTPGDHYLIEERAPSLITVRQPLGPDTPLTISLPSGWDTPVAVYGFALDGEIVGMTLATTTAGGVSFHYAVELNGHPVAGYRILPVHPLYLPFLVR